MKFLLKYYSAEPLCVLESCTESEGAEKNAVLFCSDHNFAMDSPLLDGPRPAAEAVGRDQGEHHKGGVHPRPGLCRLRHQTLLPRLRWFVYMYWRQNSISLMNARSRVILLT